jgi:hypothetical protein
MAETILNNVSFPKLFQENVPGQYFNIIFGPAGIKIQRHQYASPY